MLGNRALSCPYCAKVKQCQCAGKAIPKSIVYRRSCVDCDRVRTLIVGTFSLVARLEPVYGIRLM